jgi:hypothetical protein
MWHIWALYYPSIVQIQNHSNTNINLNFRKQHQRKVKKSSTKSTLKKQQVLMVNQLKIEGAVLFKLHCLVFPWKSQTKYVLFTEMILPVFFFVDYIDRKLSGCFWFVRVPKLKYQAAVNWKFRQRANPYKSKKITIHFSNCEYIDHSTYTQLCRVL